MQFSISASGTKEQALANLEAQREAEPDHRSLKNQVIEHVATYIDSLPAGTTGISLSSSFYCAYSPPSKTEG